MIFIKNDHEKFCFMVIFFNILRFLLYNLLKNNFGDKPMEIINQSFEIINRSINPEKLIELCGRTCYKSADKITDDSSTKFVKMLTKRGHLSVIEHAVLTLKMDYQLKNNIIDDVDNEIIKFININYNTLTANLRAWLEFLKNNYIDRAFFNNIHAKVYEFAPNIYKAVFNRKPKYDNECYNVVISDEPVVDYITVKFITNRGVTHELVRHRPASYSQESTRYVNYGGDNIQIIRPVWLSDDILGITNKLVSSYPIGETLFMNACLDSERYYKYLLESGSRPEQAREVLPNSLKTEIIVTADIKEWEHILNLRCSNAAHPQIRELMIGLRDKLGWK